MKPQLLKVPLQTEYSFSVRRDQVPYFYNRWHYHAEVELVYIEAGTGTQFVGDSIQHFGPSDLLLIGSGLPHYWRCDEAYFQQQEGLMAQATVVHFQEDFWGERFLKLPENRAIDALLTRARQGVRLSGPGKNQVKGVLARMLTESGPARIISLLQILNLMASSSDYELLSSSRSSAEFAEADTDRINQIYLYTAEHFQRKITLEEIASVANISPHSFCRFFKTSYGKTFSQFLLELRIQQACRLLRESNLMISQVCFESGFNQFSAFNKYFKQFTGKTPFQYRKVLNR